MLEELKGRATISVEEAGKVLGVGRFVAYREANRFLDTRGAEGIPVIKFGGRLLVPVPKLLAMIGAGNEFDRAASP